MKDAKYWLNAIESCGKNDENERWEEEGQKIVDRFRDKRSDLSSDSKKFNILWSNVETLKPALFSQLPKPVVSRRYNGSDPLGRAASEVLEKALTYSIDSYEFGEVLKKCIEDQLLPGRGTAKPVYEPIFSDPYPAEEVDGMPAIDENGEPKFDRDLLSERVYCVYHFWKDVRFGSSKQWEDVPWIAWRNYMTHDKIKSRFGEDMAVKIPYKAENKEKDKYAAKQAVVWEVWCKETKKVYWVAEDYEELLDSGEPPLNFKDFWNTPRPLFSMVTNDNMLPVPDYHMYKDQAEEMDALTARINILIDALKVIGFYAGEEKANISSALSSGGENKLIPVDDWAAFAEKGGVQGMISWMPVEQVQKVVLSLYEARDRTKQELYEITGLSDILRGASVASETATAQRIKGQFATLRISDRQKQVQVYARDLIRMQAEIIAEHFGKETLQEMTGLEYPDEIWNQIISLLRNDRLRSFRIDIETDSMIAVDQEAEKASRIELMQNITPFMEKAMQMSQIAPDLAPLFGQMLLFTLKGFKTGRELESSIEDMLENMQTQPQQEEGASEAEQLENQKIASEIRKNNAAAMEDEANAQKIATESQMIGLV